MGAKEKLLDTQVVLLQHAKMRCRFYLKYFYLFFPLQNFPEGLQNKNCMQFVLPFALRTGTVREREKKVKRIDEGRLAVLQLPLMPEDYEIGSGWHPKLLFQKATGL